MTTLDFLACSVVAIFVVIGHDTIKLREMIIIIISDNFIVLNSDFHSKL